MKQYLPDVNILVYAHREEMPQHAISAAWLEQVISGPDRLLLIPSVLTSFIRIATNPRIFKSPTSTATALDFVRIIMDKPDSQVVDIPADRWGDFDLFCRANLVTGDHIADAYLAWSATMVDATLVTMDRDFSRYAGLRYCLLGT